LHVRRWYSHHFLAFLDEIARVRLNGKADDIQMRVVFGVRFAGRLVNQLLTHRSILRANTMATGRCESGKACLAFSSTSAAKSSRVAFCLSANASTIASADSDNDLAGGRMFFSCTVRLPSSRNTGLRRNTSSIRSTNEP